MTPHVAWAFAQRNLTAAQRLVLIALSERANGERTCFPSEATLADDCELSRRSVIAAVQYLNEERRLIEVVTDPAERAAILLKAGARQTARVNIYRILRPAEGAKSAHHNGAKSSPLPDNESAKSTHPTNHNSAKSSHNRAEGAKSAHLGDSEGAKSASRECKKQRVYGATVAHEPLTESLHEKKREGVKSREAEASKQTPPQPEPDATPGSDTFNSYLDAPNPAKALAAEVEADVIHADVPDPDGPPPPGAFQALVASIACGFKNNYPPRATDLSRSEQSDLCQDKPSIKSAYLPDAVLRLQRKQAGIRHAADA